MTLTHTRLFLAAALAACCALAAAVPALAKTRTTTVVVTVKKSNDFRFLLSRTVVPHGSVTFNFSNQGSLAHNFKVCSSKAGGTVNACAGKGTKTISGGSKASLKVTLKAGRYEYLCTVPGHAAAGMKGVIRVK